MKTLFHRLREAAGELAEDLQRFLEEKPIQAKRPTLTQRITKWSRRHKPLVATAAVVLVLFVASSVSGERVETIARAILPFLAVEVLVIFLITYFPAVSMTIPRLTGFVQ